MPKFVTLAQFRDKETGELVPAGTEIELTDADRIERLRRAKVLGGPQRGKPAETMTREPKVERGAWPKHTGGGWYELSSGEKVQGKAEARKAQAQVDR
jgi:hypothetical protein